MNKKEKIEWLKNEKEIKLASEIIEHAYVLNSEYTFFLINEKTNQYKVFHYKNWELESQEKYLSNRSTSFKQGFKTEVMFKKRKINSVIKF